MRGVFMKAIFSGLLSLLFLFVFAACAPKWIRPKRTVINIIPRPVAVKITDSNFVLDAETRLVIATPDSELRLIAEKLIKKINAASRFQLCGSPNIVPGKTTILLSLDASLKSLTDEGYQLTVLPQRIEIKAPKPAGVFYGTQSLFQLLPTELENTALQRDRWLVPCVEIVDYPRFPWRGQLLDVSRHFHPLDHIKRNLDQLARLKMNRFHWHLTDDQGWRIEIKSLPKLTGIGAWRVDRNDKLWWQRAFPKPGEKATYGGFYTQAEIKEMIQYARERYITIIPEIDMPGHSRAFIAAYPEVSCDGGPYEVATGGDERNKDLCPGKEITFELVEKIIDEVTALFPAKYYHIGGDECRKPAWKKCPDCQKKMEAAGLKDYDALQSYFIHRVEKMINARGKIMIGWDEILEGGLAPNATVMSWRGEVGGIKSVGMGHDAIMTPFSYCYLDLKQGDPELEPELGYSQLLLSTVYSYNPVPKSFTAEEAKHILGVQGNLWSESIQNEADANYMLFPRLIAIAEVGWSPQALRDWKDFVYRLEQMLKRFDFQGINYARSAYNVWLEPNPPDKNADKVAFQLQTEAGTAPIFYTLDGREPNKSATLYQTPIRLEKTTTIKARTFKAGKPYGNSTTQTIVVHPAAGKKVTLLVRPDPKFDHGDFVLTDCLRGRADQIGKHWLGFEKDFEAVIDLEKNPPVQTITVSILEATDDRIFLPKKIEFSCSSDGNTFTPLKTIIPEQSAKPAREVKEFTAEVKTSAHYIKISLENMGVIPDWHYFDPGKKAWLFIDEIMIESLAETLQK
jgi:hexosaminidase